MIHTSRSPLLILSERYFIISELNFDEVDTRFHHHTFRLQSMHEKRNASFGVKEKARTLVWIK
jgi:hypothetical protein